MRVSGQASRPWRSAVQDGVGHRREHLADQVVTQRREPRGLGLPALRGHDRGDGERPDGGSVQGPGPDVPLLAAAVQHGNGYHFAAEDKRADPDRPAHLVPGHGEGVHAGRAEVHRDLRGGLHRVGVERHPVGVGHGRQLGHRLHRADLVVRPHNADDGGIFLAILQRGPQDVGGNRPGAIHRQPVRHGTLGIGQPANRVEHRVVLDCRRKDPPAAAVGRAPCPEQALDRQVVRLSAAAGEDHLAGPRSEDLGDLLARFLHHATGPAARVVQRRRVAQVSELLDHRLDGLRQHRSRRCVIEVDDRTLTHS